MILNSRRWPRATRTLLAIAVGVWVIFQLWERLDTPTGGSNTVNIVIATTKEGNYDWAYNISIPNMEVLPFVADDPDAPFHPPANKGHEAMAYLTYIHMFYDSLPEVSIFVHDTNDAWHNDRILESTTTYALNHLDLQQVTERGYLNLRVDWGNGCPAWINTTITLDSPEYTKFKSEEVHMAPFLKNIFPTEPVPEIFGSQCCSQFAVSRNAIRSRSREEYQMQMDWILNTELEDAVSGRVFEHMWPYLFLGKAVDCPEEFQALCRYYHICFESQYDLDLWNGVQAMIEASHKQYAADKAVDFINDKLDHEIQTLEPLVDRWKEEAIQRGASRWDRWRILKDL